MSDDDALDALSRALGDTPPQAVAALPAEVLADLTDAIQGARAFQTEEIGRALDHALRIVPRLLHVEPERLAPLAEVPLEDLHLLRDQVTSRLFDEGRESWARVAAVSRRVPAGLAATLAERALGPVLAARATTSVDIDKAVELSSRFSATFLADVATHLDPRAVDDLTARLPAQVIADTSTELARREEWLVMADFVGTISSAALTATMSVMSEAQILRVALLLEDPSRLQEIVSLLDDDRLDAGVVAAEAHRLGDALDLVAANVTGEQAERIAARWPPG